VTEFKELLDNTFTMIPRGQVGLLRGDSVLIRNNVLTDLDKRKLNYIIVLLMEFTFRWVMKAYNLMSYVRNTIANSMVKNTLSTLMFLCIAIGSY